MARAIETGFHKPRIHDSETNVKKSNHLATRREFTSKIIRFEIIQPYGLVGLRLNAFKKLLHENCINYINVCIIVYETIFTLLTLRLHFSYSSKHDNYT